MATLIRQRVIWTGTGAIGGGITHFYFSASLVGSTSHLATWFGVIMQIVPVGTSVTIESSGDLVDSTTGALMGTWNDGTTTVVPATGTGVWAAGTGMRLVFNTTGVTNNRRVRGSMFIVPMNAASYDSDGSVNNGIVSAQGTAATTFQSWASTNWFVWTKPKAGAGGKSNLITSVSVPDKVTSLRSRRV